MRFQTPLVPARLLRRYKRFLADVRLDDGRETVAHCPNPGSMMGLAEPGFRIWLEPNDDPRKKLKFGWRLVELDSGHFVGIDTGAPNKMLRSALEDRQIPELAAYRTVQPEVKYGERSRVDFLLSQPGEPQMYLEVKSVTLSRTSGLAEFPDSKTARGARHMAELAAMVANGHRAAVLFLVQRNDCTRFHPAEDLDPTYANALRQARKRGVDALCYDCGISPQGITLGKPLPHEL